MSDPSLPFMFRYPWKFVLEEVDGKPSAFMQFDGVRDGKPLRTMTRRVSHENEATCVHMVVLDAMDFEARQVQAEGDSCAAER